MRDFLLAFTIVAAAIASCSMPNFAPPKLGSAAAPVVAQAAAAIDPR